MYTNFWLPANLNEKVCLQLLEARVVILIEITKKYDWHSGNTVIFQQDGGQPHYD